MNNYFAPETPKKRGKGPRGKRDLRKLRKAQQTAHEAANLKAKRDRATQRRQDRLRTDTKTNTLLIKVKDGKL